VPKLLPMMRIHANISAAIIHHSAMTSAFAMTRKATNVTVDADLLASAKVLKINISRATEDGLKRAVAARHAELWLEANRAALETSNAYVDQKGLPLARFRNF
jgi:antitoxin CcdA